MSNFQDFGNGIVALDAGYVRPQLAAIHLVIENGRCAIIDTGSNDSVSHVRDALAKLGLCAADVDYVMLTHIHLDHAGGAGQMMSEFPNAKLVVHPRGARHMAEPSRLLAGVTAVYGADYVQQVYGEILPIPAERIIEAADGCSINLAGRRLHCLDTPGHARHHICIHDETANALFTGDTFGLSYRETDVNGAPFIFPTTTPTQFEPDAMRQSIKRLVALQAEAVYLTHYSRLGDVEKHGETLLRRLDEMLAGAEQAYSDASPDERQAAIKLSIDRYLRAEVRAHGCTLSDTALDELLGLDIELNAQGILHWLDSRG